jgi:hypothetical protein
MAVNAVHIVTLRLVVYSQQLGTDVQRAETGQKICESFGFSRDSPPKNRHSKHVRDGSEENQ